MTLMSVPEQVDAISARISNNYWILLFGVAIIVIFGYLGYIQGRNIYARIKEYQEAGKQKINVSNSDIKGPLFDKALDNEDEKEDAIESREDDNVLFSRKLDEVKKAYDYHNKEVIDKATKRNKKPDDIIDETMFLKEHDNYA
jgi:NurA-like 5'-3' nuclease